MPGSVEKGNAKVLGEGFEGDGKSSGGLKGFRTCKFAVRDLKGPSLGAKKGGESLGLLC